MPRLFDDEQRRNGLIVRGRFRVGPKSLLDVSKMLDGGSHRLALFSCSEAILDANAAKRYSVTTA